MQWIYGIGELLSYVKANNLSLGIVNISEWEKSMNIGTIQHAKNNYEKTFSTLIPNPIMDDMVDEILQNPPIRKSHKFVFHAAWARGGDVAVNVLRELNFADAELHSFDYLLATHPHTDPFFVRHNGVDKKTLFTHIAESEYFLYPLYTPYKDVHKDTFSCVVAEAIALGAIPITYPLGALPEYFNEFCVWIDFPEGIDPKDLQKQALTKDEEGVFKENIPAIVRKVRELEANPELKNELRKKGREYIINRFNREKVGKMWEEFAQLLT
jgi:glycosyltransferase involved in cell wall biosynthesis